MIKTAVFAFGGANAHRSTLDTAKITAASVSCNDKKRAVVSAETTAYFYSISSHSSRHRPRASNTCRISTGMGVLRVMASPVRG